MMKNSTKFSLLIIAVFLLISVIYFAPLVFDGKVISQHDINMWKGGAQEIVEHRDNTGEEALWTNSMFGGMPSYLVGIHYDGNLLYSFRKAFLIVPSAVFILFSALVSGFLMLRSFKVKPIVAAIGAVFFAFASFNMISISAGHNAKVDAIALMPLVVAGLNWVYRKKYLLGAIVTALGMGLEFNAGHYQITYYLLLVLGIYGISQLAYSIKFNELKHFFIASTIVIASMVLGILPSVSKLLTVQEYSTYSIRGKSELTPKSEGEATKGLDRDYAFAWSQGRLENLTYIVPNLFGGASTGSLDEDSEAYKAFRKQGASKQQALQQLKRMPLYWGGQSFTAGPIYMGAIAVFLFVLGFFILNNKQKYWLVSAFVLGLILSMGKNFSSINYLLFDYLPGLNKFRTPSMAVVIPQLIISLMAGLSLNKIFFSKEKIEGLDKKLLYALAITGGFCLFLIVFGGMFFSFEGGSDQYIQQQAPWLLDALIKDRVALLRLDALRSLLLILAAFGVIYFSIKGNLKNQYALYFVLAMVLIEMWGVNRRYLNNDNFIKDRQNDNYFSLTPADQSILQDKDLHYRVFNVNNPFNEARTSYFHKSIGGYHGAKMRRYQDVIDRYLSKNNTTVLSMLNTKYVITDPSKPAQKFQNYGNAWFVKNIKQVSNPDEEIEAIGKDDFDPTNTAVVDESKFPLKDHVFKPEDASIKLTSYSPDELKYISKSKKEGFAVFSEIYYPKGWQAYIDGKEVEHIRVDYILRGMKIPAGKHEIKFVFEPKTYYTGETVSLIGSIALFLFCIGGGVLLIVRRKK